MNRDGHALVEVYPRPSGWYGRCECGEEFRAPREQHVLDEWHAHRDDAHEDADAPVCGLTGDRGPALGRDHGTGPVDRLIAAWTAWEAAPSAPWTTRDKEHAITIAGLTGSAAHRHIAAARGRGMSVPDAVQHVLNSQNERAV